MKPTAKYIYLDKLFTDPIQNVFRRLHLVHTTHSFLITKIVAEY